LKIRAGFAIAHGKTGAEQARRKRGIFGNVDFLAVEGGAFAARSGEEFVVKGIEDRRGEKSIPLGERDRDAEVGIPMREIRCPVQRIDVPAKFRSRSALVPRSLFGGNGMVGKVFGQPFDDESFRTLVRLRHEIDFIAFVGEIQRTR
jgi:hypothetical protein